MDQRQLLLLDRLRRSNIALTRQVADQIDRFVTGQWNAMDSWRDADMVRFLNVVLPVVQAAETRVADLTNSYLTLARSAAQGTSERAPAVPYSEVTGAALRGGVEPSEVFMRPQMVLNYRLSQGDSLTTAVGAGLVRLRSLATYNVQLARTNTVAKQGRSRYYRRVLTGGENCALCVIASTQRYRRGTLMAIHGHCDCTVQEEYGDDPGQVLDRPTLDEIHSAIKAEFGETDRSARYIDGASSYSDFTDLIVTRSNSETGPTLTWRDQHFRNGSEAASLAG